MQLSKKKINPSKVLMWLLTGFIRNFDRIGREDAVIETKDGKRYNLIAQQVVKIPKGLGTQYYIGGGGGSTFAYTPPNKFTKIKAQMKYTLRELEQV